MKKTKRQPNKKVSPVATGRDSTPIVVGSRENVPTEVMQTDIDMLPASLKAVLDAGTRARARVHLPDNLKERTEAMVRRFKGKKVR